MSVVLITGTSSGIGLQTALQFARRGDTVYATMRNVQRDGALRRAAESEGLPLHVRQLDVTDPQSVERAVGEILDEQGRVDVLVNNAGINRGLTVEMTSDEELREVFDTNVFGVLRTTRAVLPAMRNDESGTVINVSSVAGRIGAWPEPAYSASKWALEALSECLAIQLYRFNIRVAVIEPGMVQTEFFNNSGIPGWDDTSPYADSERQSFQAMSNGVATGGDPRHVAAAIEHAVATDQPQFRYLVGDDAHAFIDGRARMSDEEFIETFGRPRSDEEFFAEFARRFPIPATA